MLDQSHINAIHNNQSAEIAQTQLSADLFDRFGICLIRVRLGIARASTATAIHVDRNQRFGLIEHECAAGRQRNGSRMDLVNLSLDAICLKNRRFPVVIHHFPRSLGCDHIQEHLGALESARTIDDDRFDSRISVVAKRAYQHIAFGIELAWSASLGTSFFHRIPESLQICSIALQFCLRAIEACGAQDESEAFWKFK